MRYLFLLFVLLFPALCFAPESEFGKISRITAEACLLYNVDRSHIDALFAEETGFKNLVVYEPKIKKNAYGPGCLLLNTAKDVKFKGNEKELENINVSIPLTVKFVKKLYKRYRGDWNKITSHYKTGKSRFISYGKKHNKIYSAFFETNCGA